MKSRNKIFETRSEKGKKLPEKELSKAKKMLKEINKKKFEIKQSYEIGKQFYNKEISEKDGIKKLIEKGININSANDYLNLFSNLIEGKLYINPIDEEFLHFYFKQIDEEYKEKGIKNSLLSFTQHLDYYKKISKTNSKLSKEIFQKYWNIGFQGRNIHPNEDCVKTFYVGGMNGVITKRMSTTQLWDNYKMYSYLLTERLAKPNNNLTQAYSINLAKKYYYGLTELINQNNYFKDKKGNVYLIKSKKTNKLNTLEFEISNWNFDFLVLFMYDLKGTPTYRVEIPVKVAKEFSRKNIIIMNKNNITDERNKDISTNIFVMENL